METRIVDLNAMMLVGLPYYGDPSNGSFAKAWHRLMQVELPAGSRVDEKVAYGVELYGPEFHQDRQWTYFPSFEVRDLNDIPGSLFAKTLPAAKYAVFRETGGLAKFAEMFRYAYDKWLPASGYEIAYPYDFEFYGEEYTGDVPDSVVEIYIPIRSKN
jgi:AraC family transcriptional regulator